MGCVSYIFYSFYILSLDIPKCIQKNDLRIGVSVGETVTIPCMVESYPEPSTYSWTLKSNSGTITMNKKDISNYGYKSVLKFKQTQKLDDGAFLCYGINSIGIQEDPCEVFIYSAGKFIEKKPYKEDFYISPRLPCCHFFFKNI